MANGRSGKWYLKLTPRTPFRPAVRIREVTTKIKSKADESFRFLKAAQIA
jgi:hypothetical protein